MKRLFSVAFVLILVLLLVLSGCAASKTVYKLENDAVINADKLNEYKFITSTGTICVSTGGTLEKATVTLSAADSPSSDPLTDTLESGDDIAAFSGLSTDVSYAISIQSTDTTALESALIKITDKSSMGSQANHNHYGFAWLLLCLSIRQQAPPET